MWKYQFYPCIFQVFLPIFGQIYQFFYSRETTINIFYQGKYEQVIAQGLSKVNYGFKIAEFEPFLAEIGPTGYSKKQ